MTSLFLPTHPPHPEDQPSPRTILYFHVASRAVPTGALISLLTASASTLLSRRRLGPLAAPPFARTALVHSARGSVAGLALGLFATWGRMRGREEVEWQDRSWRLLENRGQVEMDWWVLGGGVVGSAVGAMRGGLGLGTKMVGGAGLGSAVASVVFMNLRGGEGRKMVEVVREEVDRGVGLVKDR